MLGREGGRFEAVPRVSVCASMNGLEGMFHCPQGCMPCSGSRVKMMVFRTFLCALPVFLDPCTTYLLQIEDFLGYALELMASGFVTQKRPDPAGCSGTLWRLSSRWGPSYI